MTEQEHFNNICNAFFIGLILGLMTMFILFASRNGDFHKTIERVDSAQKACATANSEPSQWDRWNEVVCANGAVMNYDRYREE